MPAAAVLAVRTPVAVAAVLTPVAVAVEVVVRTPAAAPVAAVVARTPVVEAEVVEAAEAAPILAAVVVALRPRAVAAEAVVVEAEALRARTDPSADDAIRSSARIQILFSVDLPQEGHFTRSRAHSLRLQLSAPLGAGNYRVVPAVTGIPISFSFALARRSSSVPGYRFTTSRSSFAPAFFCPSSSSAIPFFSRAGASLKLRG